MELPETNLWRSAEHVLNYLEKADTIPHRAEGDAVLLECLAPSLTRVLDLGSGDGRLLGLMKLARSVEAAVALDFSPAMIDRLRARFARDPTVEVVTHDLACPLRAGLGKFDAVVSSFAIHHLVHDQSESSTGRFS